MSGDTWFDRLLASIDELLTQLRALPEADRFERKLDEMMTAWLALPEAERLELQRMSEVVRAVGVSVEQAMRVLDAFRAGLRTAERNDPLGGFGINPIGGLAPKPLLIRSQAELDDAFGVGFGTFPRRVVDAVILPRHDLSERPAHFPMSYDPHEGGRVSAFGPFGPFKVERREPPPEGFDPLSVEQTRTVGDLEGVFCPRCGCDVFECSGAATEGRTCQRPKP